MLLLLLLCKFSLGYVRLVFVYLWGLHMFVPSHAVAMLKEIFCCNLNILVAFAPPFPK